jgi:hypothetical protein
VNQCIHIRLSTIRLATTPQAPRLLSAREY